MSASPDFNSSEVLEVISKTFETKIMLSLKEVDTEYLEWWPMSLSVVGDYPSWPINCV